jgi:hypothetical protein
MGKFLLSLMVFLIPTLAFASDCDQRSKKSNEEKSCWPLFN